MRILHVVPTYLTAKRYGAPSFAVHGLCRLLAARGYHVEVFTTNVDGSTNSAVPLRFNGLAGEFAQPRRAIRRNHSIFPSRGQAIVKTCRGSSVTLFCPLLAGLDQCCVDALRSDPIEQRPRHEFWAIVAA
jgi:hypothetical protein